MISPWIDLSGNKASYETNKAKDPVLNSELIAHAAKTYLAGEDMGTTNPENAALSAFAPVLIAVGTNEALEDDSKRFYEKIKGIQAAATLTIYKDQAHVWPLSDISSDASQKLLTELDEFFNK